MTPRNAPAVRIRRLGPGDTARYRDFMLAAYAAAPEAFTSTVAEREPLPLDWWMERLTDSPDAPQLVLGAFTGDRLVGCVGLRFADRTRTRHKAWLYGMAVEPEARRTGTGGALVDALLREAAARPGIRLVQLTVAEPNHAARRLYENRGFEVFGREPMALRYESSFVDLLHMWRRLDGDPREE